MDETHYCSICYENLLFPGNCNTCSALFCSNCLQSIINFYKSSSCPVCIQGKLDFPVSYSLEINCPDDNTLNGFINLSNILIKLNNTVNI